ncbi:succinate dehydrogenase assembly factor 2, mitochondrial-like isoform X2 [Nicotiana tomentosiformis]|uniref:succinate dehydrogenase assembly factor 2, mitochondrial-like isoform X2 n=1 Tax=Nicotiana tomentosiformis TaxID=4098 RepID=UPI000878220C|nr:succinate dehydrogenase assembly factor 2, mitochondrial-like isoform X2 [Nicotiana tomentosiformis]
MANLRRALLFTIPRIHNASQRSSVANSALPSLSLYRPLAGTFSCFFTSNENFQPIDFDLSSEESKRRLFNRLRYRSKQRGFLELDLVLGKWVEDHIQSMDEYGIKSLVDILDLVFSAVREKVMNNLGKHAAPETCAAAGQPWVIG